MSERLGEWVQTYLGRCFWPLDPRPEDIDIRDIAHSLSMQCRFNGHCLTFYSVAQHSVMVSRVVDPELAKWGLLHDASEAYLCDLPRPLKRLMPAYMPAERTIMKVVAERFGLDVERFEEVREADNRMLATERKLFMWKSERPWPGVDDYEPYDVSIEPMLPGHAKHLFIKRYEELFGA